MQVKAHEGIGQERQRLGRLMRRFDIDPRDCVKFCGHGEAIGLPRFKNLKQNGKIALWWVLYIRDGIEQLARMRGWDGSYSEIDQELEQVRAA